MELHMPLASAAGLLALGAVHGINPGMGWLFAVALGLQEGSARTVWRSLVPLAIGHAAAIAAVLAVAAALGMLVPPRVLRWTVAALLLGMAVAQLTRHRHPRWGGMRIGSRDLAIWSFLMASAHGAGLMALPFVMPAADGTATALADPHAGHGSAAALAGHAGHAAHAAGAAGAHAAHAGLAAAGVPGEAWLALAGTAIHSLGYLLVTGAVAALVFHKLGLRMLRTGWINLDLLWAGALAVTAVVTVIV